MRDLVKIKAQERANRNVPVILKDQENIALSLPILLPHQVENVYKAEQRFFNPPQEGETNKGMLFTDATGTGKTYTALGILKRLHRTGVTDMLIVVPTDAKINDWIEEAMPFDLYPLPLKDTKDGGYISTISITTYANFRANEALQTRANKKPFGLVLYDESHKIVSNQGGSETSADVAHKNLTNAPNNAWIKVRDLYRSHYDKAFSPEGTVAMRKKISDFITLESRKLSELTKVVFLSATPFAYHKNLIYADGYLFNIMQGQRDSGAAFKNFFVSNFGYRIRYSKLTEPDAEVDVSMLERSFHTKLMKSGAVSSTRLRLTMDYSREFVLVDDKVGFMIDEGYKLCSDRTKYSYLPQVIEKKFSFLYTSQLLEAIKAKLSIPRIQQHLAMGRKVVVFHSYNHSLPSHPFDLSDPELYPKEIRNTTVMDEINVFHKEFPEYRKLDFSDLNNPIETLVQAFGNKVKVFNGNISKPNRRAAISDFNRENHNAPIIVVQIDAGAEGISLHDTAGTYQRATVTLGLPTKPTGAIQTEGRTYRIGQMSNAVVEYLVLHHNFEKIAFATKISERASTAENLAFGEQARNLKEAFKEGYKNPIIDAPHVGQGTGGRDADMVFDEIDDFDLAIKLYYNRGKRTTKTKSQEGTDYYATPEPLGYTMTRWMYAQPNQQWLEPSAGHGAIGRFFPENTKNKFIEPSYNLRASLSIDVNGDVIGSLFEDFNIINKFDRIAMNPPFGSNSRTAWEHLEKATTHLRDGGRVIAIVPAGASMDKYIDAWIKSRKYEEFHIIARVQLPTCTFERAGTSVGTNIYVIDKHVSPALRRSLPATRDFDFRDIEDIKDLFDRLKVMDMPAPAKAETVEYAVSTPREFIKILAEENAPNGIVAKVTAGIHTKFMYKIWTVRTNKNLGGSSFDKAAAKAKSLGGYYSGYDGNGALPGFIFKSPTTADVLVDYINEGCQLSLL